MGTVTNGFDARLANRPFLVFNTRRYDSAVYVYVRLSVRLSVCPSPCHMPALYQNG